MRISDWSSDVCSSDLIVKNVISGGPGVLWEMLQEKFSDFQSMVVDEIKNFITEKVVKAGISWILGLLTPAGAFVKACQAIRSAERRVGKECGGTCRSRWSPYH